MIHEDDRRILETFPEGKVLTAKYNCVVGGHYHKIKTEKFVALSGNIELNVPDKISQQMEIGKIYTVEPYDFHVFHLSKGAVLFGLCSHEYDPTDDYK